MTNEVYVIVPKRALEELELARIKLYGMFPDPDIDTLIQLGEIGGPMWELSHTQYEPYDGPASK